MSSLSIDLPTSFRFRFLPCPINIVFGSDFSLICKDKIKVNVSKVFIKIHSAVFTAMPEGTEAEVDFRSIVVEACMKFIHMPSWSPQPFNLELNFSITATDEVWKRSEEIAKFALEYDVKSILLEVEKKLLEQLDASAVEERFENLIKDLHIKSVNDKFLSRVKNNPSWTNWWIQLHLLDYSSYAHEILKEIALTAASKQELIRKSEEERIKLEGRLAAITVVKNRWYKRYWDIHCGAPCRDGSACEHYVGRFGGHCHQHADDD